jgi:ATP-dependent Lhr-like helicase
VATDYVLAIWSLEAPDTYLQTLFTPDILGDELEEWMAESPMLKRTFRQVAVVAGLIERKHPGHEKTGKQLSVSSDLIYDVLRRYEPDHILLEATKQEAARGLTDIARLSDFLNAHHDTIRHVALERVSPLAVPAILEIGIEPVWRQGEAQDALLDEWAHKAEALIAEATH